MYTNQRFDIKFRLFLAGLCVLVLTACQSEEPPLPGLDIPLVITIPAENHDSRVPGDPGGGITYPLPREARIYVAIHHRGGMETVIPLKQDLGPSEWTLVPEGNYYRYTGNVRINMPENIASGRVYAILSQNGLQKISNEKPKTENEVRNLTFSLTDNPQLRLADLYANPVNDTDENKNGTLRIDGNIIRTMVCCYHVAAKVDVMWNINPDRQQETRMEEIRLVHIPQTGSFFYPTTANADMTGTQVILGGGGTPVTPANQWYGRSYTYVLQRPEGVLDWTLKHRSSPVPQPATSKPQSGTVSNAFTAWYRINARVGYTDPQQP